MTKKEHVSFGVEINVSDFEKSLLFYRDTLGFEVIRIDLEDGKFAALAFYDAIFMIKKIKDLPSPRGIGVINRFLVPDNLEDYYQGLVKKGVRVIKQYKKMSYGLTRFYIADPDGFQLKFSSKESAQTVA